MLFNKIFCCILASKKEAYMPAKIYHVNLKDEEHEQLLSLALLQRYHQVKERDLKGVIDFRCLKGVKLL